MWLFFFSLEDCLKIKTKGFIYCKFTTKVKKPMTGFGRWVPSRSLECQGVMYHPIPQLRPMSNFYFTFYYKILFYILKFNYFLILIVNC